VLNIGEGEKLGDNGNQRVHFQRAAGSLGETRAALRVAATWDYIDPAAQQRCEVAADRLQAMLWPITHR
jgi:four helix bundle protein